MHRNLVPISLGHAPPQRARIGRAGGPVHTLRLMRMCRTDLAILKNKNFAAPVDSVIGKAGKPHGESYQVSDWHQPQMPPNSAIMHDSNSNVDCYGNAQNGSRS